MKQGYHEIVINNLQEIYTLVEEYAKFYKLYEKSEENSRKSQQQCVFRGQRNKEWAIEPSCNRNLATTSVGELNDVNDLFSEIAHKQHYQTGTRFIDFTLDINVALYFACEDYKSLESKDGAIYVTTYSLHKQEWYTTKSIVEIERMEGKYVKVDDLAEKLLSKESVVSDRMESKADLSMHLVSFLEHGIMVLPKDDLKENIRMFNQKGCMYICGYEFVPPLTGEMMWTSRAGKNKFKSDSINIMNCFKEGHFALMKIIIPQECKEDIIQQIKEQGITKEYLFPD